MPINPPIIKTNKPPKKIKSMGTAKMFSKAFLVLAQKQTWVIDASPDVIILDLMMPGMDGWETLTRLKSSPESRDVPVIISSVLDEDADLSKARRLGAADYIPKPWVANDLLQRIRWATTIQSKIA